MMTARVLFIPLLILGLCVGACSDPPANVVRWDASSGSVTDDSGLPTSATDGGDNLPSGSDAGSTLPNFDECASTSARAETVLRPVDIIWVIDRSGSMRGEADIVQENINDFAATISRSGIDYHVIMISAMDFVSVPAPLGTDTDRFRYVEADVQSSDGLTAPLDRFSEYSDFLRPEASTHFIIVTDDESSLSASEFLSTMTANLMHNFQLHAIASPPGSTHCPLPGGLGCILPMDGCSGPNGDAADNGDEYWEAARETGGERLSICTEDWSSLFDQLTAAIAIPMELPCRYALPEPEMGMTLDRGRVNVVYTPSDGSGEQVIPFVENYGGCTGQGWYYEDDDILMCPATCRRFEDDAAGLVEIALGCATVLI